MHVVHYKGRREKIIYINENNCENIQTCTKLICGTRAAKICRTIKVVRQTKHYNVSIAKTI